MQDAPLDVQQRNYEIVINVIIEGVGYKSPESNAFIVSFPCEDIFYREQLGFRYGAMSEIDGVRCA